MVQITLDTIVPSSVPASGWKIGYRIKGNSGYYIVPVGSPFMSQPIVFSTTDPAGTLYEGYIQTDCGAGVLGSQVAWETPCNCVGSGYIVGPSATDCRKTDSIPPTVAHSNYCLVSSGNEVYSSYGSRIYKPGFDLSTLALIPGTIDAHIYGEYTTSPQWANTTLSPVLGPMNRESVWIDADCDGNKDILTLGAKTTIAFLYNNTLGVSKTVYIGTGGDNQFKIVLNGNVIIDTGSTLDDQHFKFWHIMPVTIIPGINYFNAIATGDGSVNDAIGMAVYDNTAAELAAATDDSQLNILFGSHTLRGTNYDVATCPSGYSLDTSAGAGNYTCTRVLVKVCNSSS